MSYNNAEKAAVSEVRRPPIVRIIHKRGVLRGIFDMC